MLEGGARRDLRAERHPQSPASVPLRSPDYESPLPPFAARLPSQDPRDAFALVQGVSRIGRGLAGAPPLPRGATLLDMESPAHEV